MPVRHDTTHDLGAASDVVGLCVATDDDVMQVVTGGLLGDDQPEAVARQYEAEAAWLTGSDQPQKPPGSGLMPPS